MDTAIDGARPARPNEALLADAAAELRRLQSLSVTPEWVVIDRQERKRSTLFGLEATHEAGRTRAFYKVDVLPPARADPVRRLERVARLRDSLAFEQQVGEDLSAALERDGVSCDRPLAVDVERLSAVRLEVVGRPLGRSIRYLRPGGRRLGLDVYRKIGRAIRVVEQQTQPLAQPLDHQELERRLNDHLTAASRELSAELRARVQDHANHLILNLDLETATVWGHGDMSPSNVLVDARHVGLIDFSWRRYLAGESLAYFVARLGVEPKSPEWWRRSVRRAVLSGYGADDVASWQMSYLFRLLRWSRKTKPELRRWSRERLEEHMDGRGIGWPEVQ